LEKRLLSRLLSIYPVSTLRGKWGGGAVGKAVTVEDIIQRAIPEEDIIGFCSENHTVTKQHVFLLDITERGIASLNDPILAGYSPFFNERLPTEIREFYLLGVIYTVLVGPSPDYREIDLTFPWPITFHADASSLIIYATILEKNLNAYLSPGETAIRSRRNIDEDDLVLLTYSGPGGNIGPTKMDINRGIKHLWATDQIDAVYSKWKEAKGTHTQAMDGDFLLKRDDYPYYKEAIRGPLFKTLFRVLNIEGNTPGIFAADPSKGELFFNRYSKNPEEVRNVVRAILRANR